MCYSIPYSIQAFRWYPGNDNHINQQRLAKITNWWTGLNGKNIHHHHVTGIELNKNSGEWKAIKQNTAQFIIYDPQLKYKASQAHVCFIDGNDSKQIEAICIDFDPQQKFIVIYPPDGIERYIFC